MCEFHRPYTKYKPKTIRSMANIVRYVSSYRRERRIYTEYSVVSTYRIIYAYCRQSLSTLNSI